MYRPTVSCSFAVASTDKRENETAETKALVLGSTLTMDYHDLVEHVQCNDPDIFDDVPEF